MESLNDPHVESAVQEYFRALSTRNKNAWMALFDKSAVVHEPVGTTPAEGREGLEQVWQIFTGPFTSLVLASDEVFYSGSGAAARWSGRASSAEGRTTEFHGITVFEVDGDGMIQTVMSYWDPAAVLISLAGVDDDLDEQMDFEMGDEE
jgi:ketosteroid isomerase-like protein